VLVLCGECFGVGESEEGVGDARAVVGEAEVNGEDFQGGG